MEKPVFNFGDDDKKKLRENMEEIKQMVEDGSLDEEGIDPEAGSLQEFSGEGQGQQQASETVQEFDQEETGTGFEENSGEENIDRDFDEEFGPEQRQEPAEKSTESEGQENVESFEEQSPGTGKVPESPPEKKSRERESGGGRASKEELEKNIPEPPETKEIDVPDIDKGPLFIKRKKFDKAKKLIDQMRYISSEMEAVMNDLEAGVKQDQQIESELRDMLHGFDQDRSTVQEIISPSEEGE